MVNVFKLGYEVFYLESMINSVTQGVKATPMLKSTTSYVRKSPNWALSFIFKEVTKL